MRSILTLISVCLALVTFSQERTLYYDARHRLSDSVTARYRATATSSAARSLVRESTLDGKLIMTGSYSLLPSNLATSRNGDFVYYFMNGAKKSEGAYRDNLRTGVWKAYDYDDNSLRSETQYAYDSLDGPARYYHFGTKQVSEEGNHLDGKKDGIWKSYRKDGTLSGEVKYVAGKKDGVEIAYLEDGYTKKTTYENGTEIESHIFDKDGDEVRKKKEKKKKQKGAIYTYVEQMPSPAYDYNQFLARNVVYPDYERKHNIEGRVIVKFVIDEEGNVTDATINKGVSPGIDEEALRVVSMFPQWRPGKQNGRSVYVYFTLPIQFKLTD
jgi:TonB family protein